MLEYAFEDNLFFTNWKWFKSKKTLFHQKLTFLKFQTVHKSYLPQIHAINNVSVLQDKEGLSFAICQSSYIKESRFCSLRMSNEQKTLLSIAQKQSLLDLNILVSFF